MDRGELKSENEERISEIGSEESILISDNVIYELENGEFTFDEKYERSYEEYEEIIGCYNEINIELRNFDSNNKNFMEEYNYYYDAINYYIDEIDNILNYMINLIKREIDEYQIKIKDINNNLDIINPNDYIENTKKYKKISELYKKLSKIREINVENKCNNLIMNIKLEIELVDYKYDKMIKFIDDNSVKGKNNIILFDILTKSKNINENAKEEIKELFIDVIKENKIVLNKLSIISLDNNEIKYYLSLLDDYYIEGKIKQYNKLDNCTFESFLEKYKESEIEYNTECPICFMENIKEKCITRCGHVYCSDCIDSHLDNENELCPMCKKEL